MRVGWVFFWDHVFWKVPAEPAADTWTLLAAMAAHHADHAGAADHAAAPAPPLDGSPPGDHPRPSCRAGEWCSAWASAATGSATTVPSARRPTTWPMERCSTRRWRLSPACGAASPFSFAGRITRSTRPRSSRARGSSRASRSGWRETGRTRSLFAAPRSGTAWPPRHERPGHPHPGDFVDLRAYIQAHRHRDGPFDITHIGRTPGADPAAAADIVAPYAEAGVTWWLERIGDRRIRLRRCARGFTKARPRPR